MALHVFASIITPFGTAANNRSETEGNITTLQKLIWQGQTHSTVSAEAIRFALRRLLAQAEEEGTNRVFNEDTRINEWHDREFKRWEDSSKKTPYIDDDLLGFMSAEAAKNEGESGTANVRRAVLEVTRAISLNPWYGDFTFNAASPAATPSAAKKGENPVPYGTEVHATRYQFGLAMTPERLRDPSRAAKALRAIGHLRTVAGNHGRFLYDFSPDAIILRITDDPAPRLLYCFDTDDDGKTFHARSLLSRIDVGDVLADELILGVSDLSWKIAEDFKGKGVEVMGVKAAIDKACKDLDSKLSIAG
ncbi:MAG: type I-B CRISPR-associated protein Cas7/Cst2/DevR [bacterium]